MRMKIMYAQMQTLVRSDIIHSMEIRLSVINFKKYKAVFYSERFIRQFSNDLKQCDTGVDSVSATHSNEALNVHIVPPYPIHGVQI